METPQPQRSVLCPLPLVQAFNDQISHKRPLTHQTYNPREGRSRMLKSRPGCDQPANTRASHENTNSFREKPRSPHEVAREQAVHAKKQEVINMR